MAMNYKKLKIHEGQRINEAINEIFEDETEKNIALLSAIYGKSRDYYSSIPQGELLKLIEKTGWMAQLPEKTYLRPFRSFPYVYKLKVLASQLSKDEFVMLQKINSEESVKKLHESMSLLTTKYFLFPFKWLRVRTKDSLGEHQKRSELFRQKMSFALANACMVFFFESYPLILQIGHSYFQGMQEAAEEFQKTQ